MSANDAQIRSNLIGDGISDVLDKGAVAVLTTLIEANPGSDLIVGLKLLIDESPNNIGGFGNVELDDAVAGQARKFLASRREAETFKVETFAPELKRYSDAAVLFERIEAEPRLVIAGAGH